MDEQNKDIALNDDQASSGGLKDSPAEICLILALTLSLPLILLLAKLGVFEWISKTFGID